jgi:hypothetical protein
MNYAKAPRLNSMEEEEKDSDSKRGFQNALKRKIDGRNNMTRLQQMPEMMQTFSFENRAVHKIGVERETHFMNSAESA